MCHEMLGPLSISIRFLTRPAKLITNVVHSPKCRAHDSHKSEVQKIQRSDVDELDADHDLVQDRFEEIDAGTLLVDTKGPTSDALGSASSAPQLHAALPIASSMSSISSRRPPRKSISSARRRELVWKSQKNETVSLEEIARQFQSFLLTFSTELGFNRRRGRYTTKTAHRCPGYNRIEITLTPDIARSAIVSHLTPIPHEICPVCKEIVKGAEIFACICGRDGKFALAQPRPFFLCADFFSRQRIYSYYRMFDLLRVASSPVRNFIRE